MFLILYLFYNLHKIPKAVVCMPPDIYDTYARTKKIAGSGKVDILRLAGKETNTALRLVSVTNDAGDYLDIRFACDERVWFVYCLAPKRTIYKGSRIEMIFADDGMGICGKFTTGAEKIGHLWQAVATFDERGAFLLTMGGVNKIVLSNDERKTNREYVFSNRSQLHYRNAKEAIQLTKIVFEKLQKERAILVPWSEFSPIFREGNRIIDGGVDSEYDNGFMPAYLTGLAEEESNQQADGAMHKVASGGRYSEIEQAVAYVHRFLQRYSEKPASLKLIDMLAGICLLTIIYYMVRIMRGL